MQEESWIEHNPQLPPSPINPHRFSALAHTCMLSTEHKFSLLSLFSSCPQPCRVSHSSMFYSIVNGVLQHFCYEFNLLLYFPLGRISMREVKSIDCSVLIVSLNRKSLCEIASGCEIFRSCHTTQIFQDIKVWPKSTANKTKQNINQTNVNDVYARSN